MKKKRTFQRSLFVECITILEKFKNITKFPRRAFQRSFFIECILPFSKDSKILHNFPRRAFHRSFFIEFSTVSQTFKNLHTVTVYVSNSLEQELRSKSYVRIFNTLIKRETRALSMEIRFLISHSRLHNFEPRTGFQSSIFASQIQHARIPLPIPCISPVEQSVLPVAV